MSYDPNHEAAACTNEIFYRKGPEPEAPQAGDAMFIKSMIAEYLLEAYNAGWKAANGAVGQSTLEKS